MTEFIDGIREASDGALTNVSDSIIFAMIFVVGLLIIVSIFAFVVSIYLAISYVKYNRKENSLGQTGKEVARNILDKNDLQNIKVSATGSVLFGNSYSHYFKKIRLRRLTWKKKSVASLSMAAQKSALAIMDKEKDPDMIKRIRLTPLIYFGPLAFVPLIIIGLLIDVLLLKSNNGTFTILFTILGLVLYIIAFVMSILVLKTEKKAQMKAIEMMKKDNLATEEEIEMCSKLFKLYNIEYINDMIIALLELIYRVLQLIAYAQNGSSSNK